MGATYQIVQYHPRTFHLSRKISRLAGQSAEELEKLAANELSTIVQEWYQAMDKYAKKGKHSAAIMNETACTGSECGKQISKVEMELSLQHFNKQMCTKCMGRSIQELKDTIDFAEIDAEDRAPEDEHLKSINS